MINMRSENEIREQLSTSIDWLNIQTDNSMIVQGETEVHALMWVLGEIVDIDGAL